MEHTVIILIRSFGYENDDILGIFTSRDLAIIGFTEYIKSRSNYPTPPQGFPLSAKDLKNDLDIRCVGEFKDGSNEVQYIRDESYHLEYFTVNKIIR